MEIFDWSESFDSIPDPTLIVSKKPRTCRALVHEAAGSHFWKVLKLSKKAPYP